MGFFRRSKDGKEKKSYFSTGSSSRRSVTIENLCLQAQNHVQHGNIYAAIEAYSVALQHDPRDASIHLERSIAFLNLPTPLYDKALQDADAAIDISPGSWKAWSQKGSALSACGKYSEAELALQHAVRLASPTDRFGPQQMLSHVRRLVGSPQATLSPNPIDSQASMLLSTSSSQLPLRPSRSQSPLPPLPVQSQLSPSATQSPASSPYQNSASYASSQPPTVQLPSVSTGQGERSSDPPPQYTPAATANTVPVGSPTNSTSPSNSQANLTSLKTFWTNKTKGALTLQPFTLPGQIDFVKVQHKGLSALESLLYDVNPAISWPHQILKDIHIDVLKLPGSTFLDADTESSAANNGRYPGTCSVGGASEEYREAQLIAKPLLKLTLESQTIPPEMELSDIVARIDRLQLDPKLEDDEGLLRILGLTSWLTAGGISTRLNKIDAICLCLNKGLIDAPNRFQDFSKIRNFCAYFLSGGVGQPGLKGFLFQILLGAELYVRVLKEPYNTSYQGIITDSISALMLTARNWMENIQVVKNSTATIQRSVQTQTQPQTANPVMYKVLTLQWTRHKESIIQFAESIQWPYIQELRHFMETSNTKIPLGPGAIGDDLTDWLFGLRLPGKLFRHRIMCCLVDASDSARSIGPAQFYFQGLVVDNKSYWPDRSAVGRVLGGLPDVKWNTGWIGPVAAPVTGAASPMWVYADCTTVPIPVPVAQGTVFAKTLGFENMAALEAEGYDKLLEGSRWVAPQRGILAGPIPAGTGSSATLKTIRLTDPRPLKSGVNQATTYRVHLDFSIMRVDASSYTQATYTLYSRPLFVSPSICVGSAHPIYEAQSKRLIDNAIKVADLMNFNPDREQTAIIDARGKGEEAVARAWCSERRRNAVIRRVGTSCFACAVSLAGKACGLGYGILIWVS